MPQLTAVTAHFQSRNSRGVPAYERHSSKALFYIQSNMYKNGHVYMYVLTCYEAGTIPSVYVTANCLKVDAATHQELAAANGVD